VVYTPDDGLNFIADAKIRPVGKRKPIITGLDCGDDLFSKLPATFAALAPDFGQRNLSSVIGAGFADGGKLCLRIGLKAVDGHHRP